MNKIYNRWIYKRYAYGLGLVLFFLGALHLFILLGKVEFDVNKNLQSGLWCLFTSLYLLKIPRMTGQVKVKDKSAIRVQALFFALLMIGIKLTVGFLTNAIGGTPLAQDLTGILINLYHNVPFLVGRELIRAYLLLVFYQKGGWRVLWMVSIFCSLFEINAGIWLITVSVKEMVIYLYHTLVPLLLKNFFLSYLCIYGGAVPGIIYLLILCSCHYISPILPDLEWIISACIESILPVVGIAFFSCSYGKKKDRFKKQSLKATIISAVTYGTGILCIWFVIGVFPVYPTVIVTGSMKPLIDPGDVVMIRKMEKEEEVYALKEGDIIQFQRDDILVTHRIKKVVVDQYGNHSYQTKGDNNTSEDAGVVKANDIRGRLVKIVPYIGAPVIWLKGDSANKEGVEF